MNFDQKILQEARRVVASEPEDARAVNTHLLSMMLWHRTRLIEQMLLQQFGGGEQIAVTGGAFKGLLMRLPVQAGAPLPMMLGLYESELHPYVEAAIARGYRHIVNIGCGDGYYAIGMARRMPDSQFFAYDINPKAQEGCRLTAIANNVAGRVTIAGEFKGEDFAAHPAGETFVICDIEGGEDALLDPAKFPALAGHDILVELHELYCPGVTERLRQRFAATHNLTFVNHQAKRAHISGLEGLTELDEFLLSYEGRGGPTPWLVMTAK